MPSPATYTDLPFAIDWVPAVDARVRLTKNDTVRGTVTFVNDEMGMAEVRLDNGEIETYVLTTMVIRPIQES